MIDIIEITKAGISTININNSNDLKLKLTFYRIFSKLAAVERRIKNIFLGIQT
jgi:hypothetical protein